MDERQNRVQLLRNSLVALADYLRSSGQSLDAVVITGDVTYKGDPEGFDELPDLLDQLGDTKPEPDHIVIVPGNHDFEWGASPSSEERYDRWKRLRDDGYVIPYLDGVDIDASGTLTNPASQPLLVDDDGAFVVAAINSANYCAGNERLNGIDEDSLGEVADEFSDDERIVAVLENLRSLRKADVARISPGQLSALATALEPHIRSEPKPLIICALHHHLLPVSAGEEFKRYESITNLGEVRAFLGSNDVRLVLHGHKHHPALLVDHPHEHSTIRRPDLDWVTPVYISSVGTIGHGRGPNDEIARLVEIGTELPRARRVVVREVLARSAGARYDDEPAVVGSLTLTGRRARETGYPIHAVEGLDVDEVYQKILALFDEAGQSAGTVVRNLVCRVADGTSASSPPVGFPDVPGRDDLDEWFDEIVEWWQREDSGLEEPHFNHGERIHRQGAGRSQIEDVADALDAEPRTTRGVAVVVSPGIDDVGNTRVRMPSFCLAHFVLDASGRRLDTIAYFRKQQMRTWWPVNVGELRRLQSGVIDALATRGRDVSPGEIVTFAAEAIWGTDRPRVMVPNVDRLAQDDPAVLWKTALRAFAADEDFTPSIWEDLFADWLPGEQMEPDGVPIAIRGIEMLAGIIGTLADFHDSEPGSRLAAEFDSLLHNNRTYSAQEDQPEGRDSTARRVAFDQWRGEVGRRMDAIVRHTEELRDDISSE